MHLRTHTDSIHTYKYNINVNVYALYYTLGCVYNIIFFSVDSRVKAFLRRETVMEKKKT